MFNFAKIASRLACYVNSSFIVAFFAELPSLVSVGQGLTMANRQAYRDLLNFQQSKTTLFSSVVFLLLLLTHVTAKNVPSTFKRSQNW